MTSPDGMPPDALRDLVREVLRDVLPALANGTEPPGPAHLAPPSAASPGPAHLAPPPAPPSGIPATSSAAPPAAHALGAHGVGGRAGVGGVGGVGGVDGAGPQPVRLATDEDLHAFVLRVVALADNPKRRRDLLAGRLRFTLAPARAAAPRPADTTPAGHIPAGRVAATATSAGRVAATATSAGRAAGTATSAGRVAAAGYPADGAAAAGYPADGMAAPADHRIEKGAVTERAVQAAASAGARLVLGPRAVLTPLARDRARALGVPIEKER